MQRMHRHTAPALTLRFGLAVLAFPATAAASPPPAATDAPAPASPDAPLPVPPVPPRLSENGKYEECMDMLANDPAGADALATSWAGGGEQATHCHALAQIALGNPEVGAPLLTRLADTSTAPAFSRAALYGEAVQAWTMAGNPQAAYQAAEKGVSLDPEDPDLRVTHAIAALATGHADQALDDTTAVLDADPKRMDALVLRATANRTLNHLKDAADDIAKACAEDPDDPDALLERGIIRQRLGDLAGARADWTHIGEVAPDSETADLAEQNLALLDASPAQ
jgi:Flp pilus assembly protein TadD